MTKSSMSLLLVVMMAASGFAAAQAPAMKAGTDGGAGPTGASDGKSATTRAAVKAEAAPMKSGTQGGEGAKPSDSSSPKAAPKMTAEEKKAKKAEAAAARKARLAGKAGNTSMKDGKSAN